MPVTAVGRPLDFPRLLRLVRTRRRLRRGTALALFAVPIWGLIVVGGQAWIPRSSELWDQLGDAADPGFLALFALVGLGLLGLLVVRLLPTGGEAARIAPVFRKPPEAEIRQAGHHAPALSRALVHRPRIPLGLVGLLLAGIVFSIATGVNAAPAFRGNLGRAGHVYVVGQDAFFDHAEAGSRTTNYFLSTPQGVVIAEDGRPRDGQKWAVVHGSADMAYRVGGHSWLLVGLLFLMGVLFSIGVLGAITLRWSMESARRRSVQHLSFAQALEAGRAGGPLSLVLPGGTTRDLTYDSFRGRPVARVLRRRRAVLTGALVLVVGAAATVGVLYALGVLWPPTTRDVRVRQLVPPAFSDDQVRVIYTHPETTLNLAALVFGRRPSEAREALLGLPPENGPNVYANVDLIRLPYGVTAEQAVAAVGAFDEKLRNYRHGPRAVPVPAPPGWTAFVTGGADDREGTFVYATDKWLLWGTTNGNRASDQQLAAVAAQASQALHAYGERHFISATSRRR